MKKALKKLLYKAMIFFGGGIRDPIIPVYRNDAEYEDKRRLEDPIYLERYGYKVFSEHDEDGIIAEIFNRIGTTNKVFIEFGVQNGQESNCHYLLHKGWSGLWIEGSKKYCKEISKLFCKPIEANQLIVLNRFITSENINAIIQEGGKTGTIDLLSIDIDGNDYWVWEAINCISPRVVVIEYNGKFPPPYEWIMPYNQNHIWDGSDYHGASLEAIAKLGEQLGYQLVGTSMGGNNAFFVKDNIALSLFPQPSTAMHLYHAPYPGRSYRAAGISIHSSKF